MKTYCIAPNNVLSVQVKPLLIAGMVFLVSLLLSLAVAVPKANAAQLSGLELVVGQSGGVGVLGGTEITFPLAAPAMQDNLLVAICGGHQNFTGPPGFSLAVASGGGANPGAKIFYKLAEGGEQTITCTTPTSADLVLQAFEFRGTVLTGMLDPNTGEATGNSTAPASGSISTTLAPVETLIVASIIQDFATYDRLAWSSGFLQLENQVTNDPGATKPHTLAVVASSTPVIGTYSTVGSVLVSAKWRGLIAGFEVDEPRAFLGDWFDLHNATVAPVTASSNVYSVVDSSDEAEDTSIVLDSFGFPVISYVETLSDDLKVAHCGDANCSTGNTITIVDFGIVGQNSIALDSSGFPVISYYDASASADLKLAHCGNANCDEATASTTITTVDGCSTAPCDANADMGAWNDLVLDSSGFPVIAYYNNTNDDLRLVHCGNANCSSGNTYTTVDSTGDVGLATSLVLDSSGFPVISYIDFTSTNLKLVHCGNANCSFGNTITTVDGCTGCDTKGVIGLYTSLALDASGFPIISYNVDEFSDLKLVHCGNADCSSGNIYTVIDGCPSCDTSVAVGRQNSLVLDASGNPVIAYMSEAVGDIKIVYCGNTNCSSGNIIQTLDGCVGCDTNGVVGDPSLALDSSGNAIVAYGDTTNLDLKLVHCGDNCGPVTVDVFSLRVNNDDFPLTASSVTVALAPGTYVGIQEVQIVDESGAVLGSGTPSGDTITFSGLAKTIDHNPRSHHVKVIPKSHINMPAVPGVEYAVTATVTSFSLDRGGLTAGIDHDSATITIDNLSPTDVTSASAAPGDQQITVSWTASVSSDVSNYLVLTATSSVTGVPAEGASYNIDDVIGNATVVHNSTATSFTDTGLANGTAYFYKIFAKDIHGNYSTPGVQVSATPSVQPVLVTYYFDAYNTGEAWPTNPGNMVNGSTTTFSDTTGNTVTQLNNSNTATSTNLGSISKVELRVHGYQDTGDNGTITLRPVFNGTADGNNHTWNTVPEGSGNATFGPYFDITTDTNAPATWIWADVDNLDVDVVANKVGAADIMHASKVEIRVTYLPLGDPVGVNWSQATANAQWTARHGHTSLDFNSKMWVIGGGPSIVNDVWYSIDGVTWTRATANAQWVARGGHTSVVFDFKMWVIGGCAGFTCATDGVNDVWYSTSGSSWTRSTVNAQWAARSNHTSLVFDSKMWVIGGVGTDSLLRNDVWYSFSGSSWTRSTANSQWAARNEHTSLVFDSKMWVIGGIALGVNANDVWYSTSGSSWTQSTANSQWPGRNNHTSLVFSVSGESRMWVIGGGKGLTRQNDVWYSTSGSSWTQSTANSQWAARNNHTSLVFNSKMWVIGGHDGTNVRNDVWYSDP